MQIRIINALQDNYCYLLDNGAGIAVLIDPGEAAPALAALGERTLHAILITHHHPDHIGGVADCLSRFPAAILYTPATATPLTHNNLCKLRDGDTVTLNHGLPDLTVTATPGHTLDHITYHGDGNLFSGDTLFIGGCGRVLEGSMKQMHDSLAALAALPDDTRIHCGHEYTHANLRFAQTIEPENPAIRQKIATLTLPTVPGNLAEEKQTNPFLRLAEPAVIAAAETRAGKPLTDSVAIFQTLRQWKDTF